MNLFFDSCWRAAAYMVMPRVIGLSLLPLLIAGSLALVCGYFFWDAAVASVRATLEGWWLVSGTLDWLDGHVGPGVRQLMAPTLVVMLTIPLIVVLSLFLVAVMMTPALVGMVATRRFAALEARHGAGLWQSWLWSLGCTALALVAMIVTLPLWLVPPLILVLPPLIWGWMTSQVFGFDVLADHATTEERRAVLKAHRWPMLAIGIITGYMGAAPTLIWAAGALSIIFAPVFIALSVWLYTLVFAFTALWFAHYGLAALQTHRVQQRPVASAAPAAGADVGTAALPAP